MKITKKQIRALRAAAGKVFDDDEDYHDWLANCFLGIVSTKDLSAREASQAIGLLRKSIGYEGNVYGSGRRGDATGFITHMQALKIRHLIAELGWGNAGKLKFIKRQTGRTCDIRMLRNYEATKVIVGLQRVLAGGDNDVYKRLNEMVPGEA